MTYEQFQLKVKEEAEKAGVTQYELYYTESEDVSVRAMNGEISTFSSDKECGAGFRCIVNGKMGYSATELFTEEQAAELVQIAVENAATIESEDEVFIFSGSDSYAQVEPKMLEEENLPELALSLYNEAVAVDERVQSNSMSSAFQALGKVQLMNSSGLNLSNTYMMQGASVMALIKSDGAMYNGHEGQHKPLSELDPAAMAKKAVEGAIEKIGAEPAATGKYPIVLSTDTMSQFLSAFGPIFSADMAQKGLSLLAGKEGQQIASEIVTLVDDPMYEESMMKTPFDAEGVATATKTVIEKGVLKTLLHNLKTAKKAGVASTANASKAGYASPVAISPYTFYIEKGEATLEELFAEAGTGVYITQLKGLHAGANAVTGDFSLECSGFMIRNGKKAEAVTSFTASGNFFELLKKIKKVGCDLEFQGPRGYTMIGSPSILVSELSIAGK